MYTSDETKTIIKKALVFVAVSAFCAFFGAVYELFSHEVYSYFMIYAFAVPLLLGALPLLSLTLWGRRPLRKAALSVWSAGIATLTVGCMFKGVLDIYGTTNRLIVVYPAAGAFLLVLGLVIYFWPQSAPNSDIGTL